MSNYEGINLSILETVIRQKLPIMKETIEHLLATQIS